jgi:hypothetical protein
LQLNESQFSGNVGRQESGRQNLFNESIHSKGWKISAKLPKRTFEAGEKYFERWKMLRDRKSFTPYSHDQFIFSPTFYLKTQKKILARARVVLAIQEHKCPPFSVD